MENHDKLSNLLWFGTKKKYFQNNFFSITNINNRLRWPGDLKYYPDKVKILWFWFESVDDLLLSLQSAFFGNQFGKVQTAHAQWVKKISKRGRIGLYENLGD